MKTKPFTLVELTVSMAIFMIIMLSLMTLFNSSQKIWLDSSGKMESFENARIALDLMAKDLQAAYYNHNAPFWHLSKPGSPPPPFTLPCQYCQNELLAFVSATSIPPNDQCTSEYCEVKYVRYWTNIMTESNAGWILRSVTGDKTIDPSSGAVTENDQTINASGTWNFINNFTVSLSGPGTSAYTADDTSGETWRKLIPHVTNLTFRCYDKNKNELVRDTLGTTVSEFPTLVEIVIKLLDKSAWEKWVAIGGNDIGESSAANVFRLQNERVFTRVVYLGDR